ncbi:MAG: hypothetical protein ABDK87_05370, partial [Atribacterota bacterium]
VLSMLFCLLFLGCAVSPSISVSFGEQVQLAFGQTLFLKGTKYAVTFKDVLEDSRCPQGVECFWEGRVLILLQVGEDTLILEVQPSKLPVETVVSFSPSDRYRLVVAELFPSRLSLEPPEKAEYAITLWIESEVAGGWESRYNAPWEGCPNWLRSRS